MSTLRDAMSHAALGWVKPELDETLRQVRNEVEYYAEDPTDASRMRICRASSMISPEWVRDCDAVLSTGMADVSDCRGSSDVRRNSS